MFVEPPCDDLRGKHLGGRQKEGKTISPIATLSEALDSSSILAPAS
jgi:hypothetical protein